MTGLNIASKVYKRISEKIRLSILPEFDDLKTIVISDGSGV